MLAPTPKRPADAGHVGPEPSGRRPARPLYTPAERARRDASPWTTVQAVLAPLQFAVFAVSLVLVIRYLTSGQGFAAATVSIVLKTLLLYAIMITGSIWERDVFGRFLFVSAFFWEDVVSMGVLALHTAYLMALFAGWLSPAGQMALALAAYFAYVVNAAQFVLKLRAARLSESCEEGSAAALNAHAGLEGAK